MQFISRRAQTLFGKRMPSAFYLFGFCLPLAILDLFQGFYYFLVQYQKYSNNMYFSESDNFTCPGD